MPPSSRASTPIYARLFERYKEGILAYRLKPGSRIDSISEIQKRHGVARETAKRVLNLLAEEGYVVKRPGKGSFVADFGPKQEVWGLVFPFHSMQYDDLIVRVAGHASAAGRELRHFCDYNDYEEEIRLVGMMLNERYEAVVVIPTLDESKTWDFYSTLSPLDSPVVLLDHTMTSHDFGVVVQSYDLGVVRAIEYLMEEKGGGIVFIENEIWPGRNMVLEVMRETYLDLMRRKRPAFEPLVMPQANAHDLADLRGQGVTGFFCCDDVSAIRTIGRLREQGALVPEDFNVVSYGNTDLSRFFTPPITSVDPHHAEMAAVLAEILLNQDTLTNQQHVVQPELIVRGT